MKDNPQAFPVAVSERTESSFYEEGMTLRDYFAAKAAQGIMANPTEMESRLYTNTELESFEKSVAYFSYELADAMLKERNKK